MDTINRGKSFQVTSLFSCCSSEADIHDVCRRPNLRQNLRHLRATTFALFRHFRSRLWPNDDFASLEVLSIFLGAINMQRDGRQRTFLRRHQPGRYVVLQETGPCFWHCVCWIIFEWVSFAVSSTLEPIYHAVIGVAKSCCSQHRDRAPPASSRLRLGNEGDSVHLSWSFTYRHVHSRVEDRPYAQTGPTQRVR